MSWPRKPRGARGGDRGDEPVPGQRVLAAQVQVAVLAAGGDAGDRHRLDDEERVVLEDHAVLERPRLGLVGVADQVVRALGVAGDRLPLAPGRERGAAAAHQLGVARPRAAPGPVPSRSPRAAPRSRRARGSCRCSPGSATPTRAQQPQRRIAGLRDARRRRGRRRRRRRAGSRRRPAVDRRDRRLVRLLARHGQHARRARARTCPGTGSRARPPGRCRGARPRARRGARARPRAPASRARCTPRRCRRARRPAAGARARTARRTTRRRTPRPAGSSAAGRRSSARRG